MRKIVALVAVLIFIASTAMAQHRHHRMMHHRMHHRMHHPMHHHHMHHHR